MLYDRLLPFVVLLAGGATALAQSPAPSPPADSLLDLPVTAPSYQPQAAGPAPQPTASPGEPAPPRPPPDPLDEPLELPTLYGEPIESEGNTIIYVLDISCSMAHYAASYRALDGTVTSGPRIDRARVELVRSITSLPENFRFNLIAYGCSVQTWSEGLTQASEANKASALAWMMALVPDGSTATGPATVLALEERENLSVVLLTDGAPNCGVTPQAYVSYEDAHRRVIRLANTQGATINVFGIDATNAYRAFCQGVAADSGGSFFDVP